jgi:hypothetical protein
MCGVDEPDHKDAVLMVPRGPDSAKMLLAMTWGVG